MHSRMIQAAVVRLRRTVRGACRGMTVMDRDQSHDCPRVIIEQLDDMVAFADAKSDFVLAAWLVQAQERLREQHMIK